MFLPRINNCLLCLGVLLVLTPVVYARESDRQKPMDVEADHTQTSTAANGATHLWGNVHSIQGTLEMKADDALLSQNKDGLSRVVLKGNPVHLKQDDENGEPMTATSQNLDYDLVKKIAVLTGNVIITQPRGVMHGERVVYDVGSGVITSGGDGTRVRMHIEPKPASAASDKAKKAKKTKKDNPTTAPASDKSPARKETPIPPAKSASGTP